MSMEIDETYYLLDKVKFNYRSKRASKKTEHFVIDSVNFCNIDGKDVWFELSRRSFFKPTAVHDILINVAVCVTFVEDIPEDFVFDKWFDSLTEDEVDNLLYEVFADISTLMSSVTGFGYKIPLITAPSNYFEKFKK